MTVLRWGQSAYETDADLAKEAADAHALGLNWRCQPAHERPDLTGVRALVVTSKVRVTDQVLDRFDGDLVLTTTSGHEHIDAQAARSRGIQVGRTPMARRDPVVETAIAGLTGLLREIPRLNQAALEGRWVRSNLPHLAPRILCGSPVAVVGCGVIGARMCAVLNALGAEVLAVDPNVSVPHTQAVSLDEALARAIGVTLHCDLNASTVQLFNARRVAHMQPGAVLINTARGNLLDVSATVDAVRQGHLRGALVDVFPVEPYPELAREAAVPGIWFTPHSAGFTHDLGARVAQGVQRSLQAWVRGQKLPYPV